jgi:purine-binding chemotaxis protein CheW
MQEERNEHAETERSQYLTFHVGGEQCAVPVARVAEIVEHQPVTRVPSAGRFILGVFNLRGNVVPAIDLAARLGLQSGRATARSCLVLLHGPGNASVPLAGVLTDQVSEIVGLLDAEVEPVPALGCALPRALLTGVARIGGGFAWLLDLDRVLELEADEERTNPQGPAALRASTDSAALAAGSK